MTVSVIISVACQAGLVPEPGLLAHICACQAGLVPEPGLLAQTCACQAGLVPEPGLLACTHRPTCACQAGLVPEPGLLACTHMRLSGRACPGAGAACTLGAFLTSVALFLILTILSWPHWCLQRPSRTAAAAGVPQVRTGLSQGSPLHVQDPAPARVSNPRILGRGWGCRRASFPRFSCPLSTGVT